MDRRVSERVTDLSDSLFIATGTFPNGKRFKFFDYKGTPLAYVGDYPVEEKTDLPFYIVGISFLSIMTSLLLLIVLL